ncbi:PTS transporter subunit EIIC [Spiroplasma tabanidicola]|uniref:PTS sugar transporter subunit IIC n=1 Tax=Spiroplasma tabanidicola TaxID=324079 RepID=A0A6I6CD62_9MOLU|nr:PTS transporter subunit EIIC [Spiroplasma tabanidicola]QGS52072.1 PTS sugar transporter subunit IIC [Spiroplasma tabanidicola]
MNKSIKINYKHFFGKLRSSLEGFGRAILVPVTVIPLLALIGSIGYAGQAIATQAGTYTGNVKIAFDAIKNIGMIAISNIDFLVAVGLAAGLAKSEKVSAALSGLMAYAAIHFAANLMLQSVYPEMLKTPKEFGLSTRFGVTSFQYSAFGGMIAGLLGFYIHKLTYKLKFPEFLSFFGGPRFSPVASTLVAWIIGMPLGILWIYISQGLKAVGNSWQYLDAGAPFLYGVANRALIPFGLHQVLNYFLYYTSVGGEWISPSGEKIEGIYNIAIAKLGSGEFIKAKDTWIVNGTFPTNIFSLTGAALAMYFCIPKGNRKVVGSAIISALLASMLAGTTEPLEFTFLFSAPILYGIHVFFTGFTYMIMYVCNFAQVSTRGSGIITWLAVDAINWNKIQNVWGLFVVGPIMGALYFGTFFILIKKLNLKTPGRDGKVAVIGKDLKKVDQSENVNKKIKSSTKNKKEEYDEEFIKNIIDGCGGPENIKIMANCVTRLRVTMFDKSKFNKELVDKTKPYGYAEIGDQMQIIYGPRVTNIATIVREKLGVES